MHTIVQRWLTNLLTVLCILMLYLIYTQKQPPDWIVLHAAELQNFKTLFISIVLEALPFVLLGVFVSALLQVFVSEQTIRRWMPKNPWLGIVFACLAGLIFPLCECGMIPIIRRLISKGMPVYTAVVFILAGPIINPVVYASTFMAFQSRPEIAYSRMALAFIVAATIGLLVYRLVKTNPLRLKTMSHSHDHNGHTHTHTHTHTHDHDHEHVHEGRPASRVIGILGHASDEFFDMGKYLIFGACLTAWIQAFVSRESLVSIGDGALSSHLFMMGFAFILSLCSTSDAFVASSFAATFSAGSLLTFLVFGPMIDLKNLLMLLSTFRVKFVLLLSAAVALMVLAATLIWERLFF